MLMPSIYGENLFDEFFHDFPFFENRGMQRFERKGSEKQFSEMMKTDVQEREDGYIIEMELPGYEKEDVKASLENGYLSIQATKNYDTSNEANKNGKYIRRERYMGSCKRTFYVGEEVTQQEIKAEFRQGILKLFVPKKESKPVVEQNNYIAIEG